MSKSKNGASAFDEIIEKFGSDDDKSAFLGLAERNPWIKEYGLRQADYSRFLNEKGDDLKRLEQWDSWRQNEWDDEHKMTKAEAAKVTELARLKQEKEELEQKLAFGGLEGGEVDFAQLETWGNDWMKKQGVVTEKTLGDKQKEVEGFVTGLNQVTAYAAMWVPFLNQKHRDEFGEMFDPEEFLKTATEKKRFDLKDFYDKDYVVEKRQQALQAKHAAELKAVGEERDAAVKKAVEETEAIKSRVAGMGSQGMTPTDGTGADMPAFQRKYLGLDKKEETEAAPGAILGDGSIAAVAAARFQERQLAGRS